MNTTNTKIFCIGANKTGTTSLEKLFKELGYALGDQARGEMLIKDWASSDFETLQEFVSTGGQVFQDVPFSLPGTFQFLDQKFPDSKFILTIRDCDQVWWKSLTSFHSKLFGSGKIPSAEDLKTAEYRYKGWTYETMKLLYNTPDNDLYNKEILTGVYNKHNQDVIEYFGPESKKLMVINLKEDHSARKICEFVGSEKILDEIPWENASTTGNKLKQLAKKILKK